MEYRLPKGTNIRSREDGEIYTMYNSQQTDNQFGYGVYFYKVEEKLDICSKFARLIKYKVYKRKIKIKHRKDDLQTC